MPGKSTGFYRRFVAGILGSVLSASAFLAPALAEAEQPQASPAGEASANPLLTDCLSAKLGEVALSSCTKAINSRQLIGQDLASALLQRGMAQAGQGKLESAVGDFSAALKQVPDATDVLYARASAYVGLKRHDLALADLGAILAIDPKDIDTLYRRAWSLAALGRDAEAVGDLNAVLMQHAGDIDALMDRGGLLLRLGKFEESIADFTAIVKIDKKAAAAYYNRGRARLLVDKVKESAADFEQALTLRTDNPYAAIRLYLARLRLGKADKNMLNAAIGKFPIEQWPMPIAAMLTGTLSEEDLMASVAMADPAVADRLAAETQYYLGVAAKAKGEKNSARRHFELAAKGDRSIAEAVDAKLELGKL